MDHGRKLEFYRRTSCVLGGASPYPPLFYPTKQLPFKVNFLPPKSCPALGPSDLVALAVLVSSLVFEVVADRQKQVWRASKDKGEHHEKFIASGLWSLSRHPKCVIYLETKHP